MTNTTTDELEGNDEPGAAWERQPGERPRAYQAFAIYRELGAERSLRDTARMLGHRSPTQVERWSSANDWSRRVAAYDDYLDEEQRLENRKNLQALERGEIQLIRVLRSLALQRVLGYDGGGDPSTAVAALRADELSPRDVAAILREATRMAEARPERRQRRAELLAQAQAITPEDFVKATSDIAELAIHHIPEEGRHRFAEDLRAYTRGELRMNRTQRP